MSEGKIKNRQENVFLSGKWSNFIGFGHILKNNFFVFLACRRKKKKKIEMSIFFPHRAQYLHVGGPRRPNNILRMPLA